ncbi:hypothetical protein LTR78_007844 [Recurvomyces mirabilis]|uniref:Uncharacterized protein n=1 Tax=Recurvomyces mirabilis TaxID=574656 RepID=A0AAE0TTX6_9PEZI|nr:hypothetical protein LTR78_007844 [Recurvomyces mirabilis]KAK5160114.1 hypothetical protein LTS14_002221 [Recurvomyces mirabilis]
MANLSTKDGFTILHLVGETLGQMHFQNAQRSMHDPWSQYAERMLKAGADPCSLGVPTDKRKGLMTPLLASLKQGTHTFDDLRLVLQAWASLVHRAGLDLSEYGAREANMWSLVSQGVHLPKILSPWGHSSEAYYAHVSLHTGPKAQDWTIVLSGTLITQTYVLQQPPGAFPRSSYLPGIIAWPPTTAELQEGRWLMQEAKSRQADRIALNVMAHQNIEPFGELVESTQDDTSSIVLLSERSARRGIPPRSHSEPRSSRGQQMALTKSV